MQRSHRSSTNNRCGLQVHILHVIHFCKLISLFIDWHKCHFERSAANEVEAQIICIFWSTKGSTAPDAASSVHGCGHSLKSKISLLQKAVAVTRQEALLSRLSQSQEACEHLKEQLEALRRHSLSLQDSCTQLQTLNTQLQVTKHTDRQHHYGCSTSEEKSSLDSTFTLFFNHLVYLMELYGPIWAKSSISI